MTSKLSKRFTRSEFNQRYKKQMTMAPQDFLQLLKSKSDRNAPVDIEQMRSELEASGAKAPIAPDIVISQTELGGVPTSRFSPPSPSSVHILYFHGGGFTVGSPLSHQGLTSAIAAASGANVWSVDYRLAPEHPFPAALDDGFCAYRELLNIAGASQNIIIAGDSAGGGLSVSTALRARSDNLDMPSGLVLLSPWTDLTLSGQSHNLCKEKDHLVWHAILDKMANLYASGTERSLPLLSPAFADLSQFPSILIHAGSEEILLSDSTALAERAGASGVSIELKIWPGMPHVFQAYSAFLDDASLSIVEIAQWIRQCAPNNQRQ